MWTDFIIPVLASLFATYGFTIVYNIRGKNAFLASLCGALAWTVYLLCKEVTSSLFVPFFVSVICIFIMVLLVNSTYGRAFKAVRDDEIAAEAMGINLAKHKMASFCISSFFAGVGGALFLFKPTNEEGCVKNVKIRGLNPDLTYRAEFYERKDQSFTVSGAELMEKGLTCVIEEACGSEIVFFMVQK